jgi:hypothetical protein
LTTGDFLGKQYYDYTFLVLKLVYFETKSPISIGKKIFFSNHSIDPRSSTLSTLLQFHTGPISLGSALKKSLHSDPVDPVLADNHFKAIDRRVGIILLVSGT